MKLLCTKKGESLIWILLCNSNKLTESTYVRWNNIIQNTNENAYDMAVWQNGVSQTYFVFIRFLILKAEEVVCISDLTVHCYTFADSSNTWHNHFFTNDNSTEANRLDAGTGVFTTLSSCYRYFTKGQNISTSCPNNQHHVPRQ